MKLKPSANLIVLCLCILICFFIITHRSSDQLCGEPTSLSTDPEEYQIQTEKLTDVHVKKLPTVFIIGLKKCGSGALIEILKLHPEIAAPDYGYERLHIPSNAVQW